MSHERTQEKLGSMDVSLAFLFISLYFYFKGYIHAKVQHVITNLLIKFKKIKMLQNPFTCGNIYDKYNEVNYIFFLIYQKNTYIIFKKVLIHVQNNFF